MGSLPAGNSLQFCPGGFEAEAGAEVGRVKTSYPALKRKMLSIGPFSLRMTSCQELFVVLFLALICFRFVSDVPRKYLCCILKQNDLSC